MKVEHAGGLTRIYQKAPSERLSAVGQTIDRIPADVIQKVVKDKDEEVLGLLDTWSCLRKTLCCLLK